MADETLSRVFDISSVAEIGGPSVFWAKKNRQKGEKPAGQVNQNRPPPPNLSSRSRSAADLNRVMVKIYTNIKTRYPNLLHKCT